jgi:hypothetical protein
VEALKILGNKPQEVYPKTEEALQLRDVKVVNVIVQ